MPSDIERLERDFTEMKLFHRDVVNELKGQGEVLIELKDYIKELAEYKNGMGQSILLLTQSVNAHISQEQETIKRIYETIELKELTIATRLKNLEDNQKWTVRTIIGAIILGLLYSLGIKH